MAEGTLPVHHLCLYGLTPTQQPVDDIGLNGTGQFKHVPEELGSKNGGHSPSTAHTDYIMTGKAGQFCGAPKWVPGRTWTYARMSASFIRSPSREESRGEKGATPYRRTSTSRSGCSFCSPGLHLRTVIDFLVNGAVVRATLTSGPQNTPSSWATVLGLAADFAGCLCTA